LPGGGGYTITGLYDVHALAAAPVTVQTYSDQLKYVWNGFDTNWNWRGPRGVFVQAGTSTSRINRDTCGALTDLSTTSNSLNSLVGRTGAAYQAGCLSLGPYQTTVRGSAIYTIPKVDVLLSVVFQSLPGTELTANETISKGQAIWANPARGTAPCALASNGTGCFLGSNTFAATTWSIPLLLNNEMFGARIQEWDMKLAKNIRFKGKRLNVGVDVYNLFNSDGITQFNTTYTANAAGTGPAANNAWGQPLTLISPRYVRLQLQANF